MKIVVLDGGQLNPGDLSWDQMASLGDLEVFEKSPVDALLERAAGAEVVVTNKVLIGRKEMRELPDLRCIIVSATGFNIIDVEAARDLNITVCNAPSYSNESVAQHVFALIFAIYNMVEQYATEVRSNRWAEAGDWSYSNEPVQNVFGKTIGIVGFGQIGQRLSLIAQAFGMKVIAHHKHPARDARPGVEFVSLKDLLSRSDVVSLHVPLNDSTFQLINEESLQCMRNDAILINTGRGPLVDEIALAKALEKMEIRAAGLDVLCEEPPPSDHPLYRFENCLITPHLAWAGVAARKKLMNILVANLQAYQEGKAINVVS